MPAVLSDEATFKHRIGIVQTPGKVVRVIDESLNVDEGIVDELVVGPIFEIANWRIYADDGSPDVATPLAAENTAIRIGPGMDVEFGDDFFIRFQLNELNISNPPLADYRLRKQINGVSSDLANIAASNKFNLGQTVNVSDGVAVTSSILTSPGGTFETGEVIEDVNSPPRFFNHDFNKNGFTELVVVGVVLDDASGGSAVDGDQFRVGIQLEDGVEIFTGIIATVDEGIVSADYPNEPAGLNAIALLTFEDGYNAQIGSAAQSSSSWKQSNMEIIDDASTPSGTGKVMRGRFPSGMEDGISPWQFFMWGPERDSGGGQYNYDELYISYRMRIEGPDYENQQVGTKIYFVGFGSTDQSNNGTPWVGGDGTNNSIKTSFQSPYRLHHANEDGSFNFSAKKLDYNTSTTERIECGQWVQLESYFKVNTIDVGAGTFEFDGILRHWIDGVLVIDRNDWAFRSHLHPKGFYNLNVDPTWGGNTADGARTREDFWRIDEVYISAAGANF